MNQDQPNATHWMVRLADSDLFRKLPANNIRILLEHIQKIDVLAGDVVINEGDPGDYYYVIESGRSVVSRRDEKGVEKALAELSAGHAFGEEEMVAGHARNTSVTMLTDGELLRLTKQQFIDVVRDALVDTVPYAIAQRMHTEGAVWIDVRESEEYTNGALPTAINLPLSELRENARGLIKDQPYLVCGENGATASVATLLLAQHGFDAVCVTEPVSASLPSSSAPAKSERLSSQGIEPSEKVVAFPRNTEKTIGPVEQARVQEKELGMSDVESTEPIPRNLYDDTYVGQSLADLIDQMHSRHQQLLKPDEHGDSGDTDVVEVIGLDTFQAEVEKMLSVVTGVSPAISLTDDEPPASLANNNDKPGQATTPPQAGTIDEQSVNANQDDKISALMRSIEAQVRTGIEQGTDRERQLVRRELADRMATVKQAAIREVHKQVEVYRGRFRSDHTAREQKLKTQYDKLMGLAHRISRQKAELQSARKDLQAKLDATARLQSEIDSLRTNLTESLDSFDGIDDDTDTI